MKKDTMPIDKKKIVKISLWRARILRVWYPYLRKLCSILHETVKFSGPGIQVLWRGPYGYIHALKMHLIFMVYSINWKRKGTQMIVKPVRGDTLSIDLSSGPFNQVTILWTNTQNKHNMPILCQDLRPFENLSFP